MSDKNVKARVAFEKLVKCEHCQCEYRIGKSQVFVGHGQTEEVARRRALAKAYVEIGSVPFAPCPACFRYPKRSVALIQFRHFGILFLLSGGLLGGLFFLRLITARTGNIPRTEFFTATASGLAAFAILVCIWIIFQHPDRNRDRNRQKAEDGRARGAIAITHPRPVVPEEVPPYRALSRGVVVCMVGAVAMLLFQAAMIYRITNGWHDNSGLHPGVCGPGDEVRVGFDDKVTTVGPFWRGRVVAKLEVDGSNSPPTIISATSNQEFWDPQQIRSKGNSSMPLWADVTIPSDPKLAGRTGRLHLVMDVTYPTPAGPGRFDTTEKRVEKTVDVKFAGPGAAGSYREVYFTGVLSGCIILLGLLGVMTVIAGRGRNTPSPVTIHPITGEAEPPPESDPPFRNPDL
jgi:hypothetical protein